MFTFLKKLYRSKHSHASPSESSPLLRAYFPPFLLLSEAVLEVLLCECLREVWLEGGECSCLEPSAERQACEHRALCPHPMLYSWDLAPHGFCPLAHGSSGFGVSTGRGGSHKSTANGAERTSELLLRVAEQWHRCV